ncbi:MAG TPA: stringent starvation protein B, partial [Hyphomonas adhaerens]|nr:stringent starvation protein B [Hyphomonas adhaerens]
DATVISPASDLAETNDDESEGEAAAGEAGTVVNLDAFRRK